jgi:hypothetical protein
VSGDSPNASLAHSVIAAGLADPRRLRSWADDATPLEALGIDPMTIDLDALARFAGLAEKVRHNRTRASLPLTFRLLTTLGLDIDLFSDYAQNPRKPGRGASPVDRVNALAAFVEDWAGSDADKTLVRDMIRHEHALARLGSLGPVPDDPPRPPPMRSDLAPRGKLLVRHLTIDPRQAADVLRHQNPQLATIERGSWTFVYQREPSEEIRLLQVDPAVGDLLMLMGGGRSLTELAGLIRSDAEDPALLEAFDQLVDGGLLIWRR